MLDDTRYTVVSILVMRSVFFVFCVLGVPVCIPLVYVDGVVLRSCPRLCLYSRFPLSSPVLFRRLNLSSRYSRVAMLCGVVLILMVA